METKTRSNQDQVHLGDDNFSRDQVTPYRLSLLILIKEYADIYDGNSKRYPRMIWQDEWASKRHLDRSLLSWIQQPDGSLKDIMRTVSVCSKVLYNAVTWMLQAICNFKSIRNIENFFSNLGYTLYEDPNSLLDKRGLLGLFCRRMLIYYERLMFCEIQPLFENFKKYCSSHISLKKFSKATRSQDEENEAFALTDVTSNEEKELGDDMELESQSEMDSKSSRESIDADLKPSDLKTEKCEDFEVSDYFTFQQAEYFFSHQAALIESKESDALPPATLQSKIRQVLKANPELTQAHYVSYLNNLRLREFCGAMDSLFMYFIRHQKKYSPLSLQKIDDKYEDKASGRKQRFATLNLALLHVRFGHKKAALAAVKESIKLSQLANDGICLQHAMSLLNYLQPKDSSHKVAEEIIRPAKVQKLTDLAFMAVQSHMNTVSTAAELPCLVFRNLAAADALQCTRPYMHLATTSFAHKASLWRMYGKRHMAVLYCQLALSMQTIMDKNMLLSPTRYNSEDIALCLSHIVELLSEEGMAASSSDLLSHTKLRFPSNSRHSHFWRKSEARLNHKLSLHLYKHAEATQAESVLTSQDVLESMLRKAESLASRNENLMAHKTLLEILESKNLEEDEIKITPEFKCQVFILMGDLLSRNQCEQAAGFRYLLEALSIARKCYLHGLVNEAMLKIAQLQLHSNSASVGLSCLQSISFECMANSDLHTRSRLFLVAVRCAVKMKKERSIKETNGFINALLQSQDGFEKTQDLARQRDVVFLLAKLFNEKSDSEKASKTSLEAAERRNECAAEFRRLDAQLGSLKYSLLV